MELLDDKKRIDDFLKVLPASDMEYMELAVRAGRATSPIMDKLENFGAYADTEIAHYTNPSVEAAFMALFNAFEDFEEFYANHTSPPEMNDPKEKIRHTDAGSDNPVDKQLPSLTASFRKFRTTYDVFLKTARRSLTEKTSETQVTGTTILVLDKYGGLSLKGDPTKTYLMSGEANMLKLLRYLMEHEGLTPTKNIAEDLGLELKSLRNHAGKLRSRIKGHLGIDIIKNHRGAGYGIAEGYAIQEMHA